SQNELWLALESERVEGAVTEQTPAGFPRAHLRRSLRNGMSEDSLRAANNFRMRRIVPDELKGALKNQRGYNRFVSPWIIAIADPRATKDWNWQNASTAQQKKDLGCESCERPKFLKDFGEGEGVYELWTNGRFIAIRPELNSGDPIFKGTRYQYLGEEKRMLGRITTVMAD